LGKRFEEYKTRQAQIEKLYASADIDETFRYLVRIMTTKDNDPLLQKARDDMWSLAKEVALNHFQARRSQRELGWFIGYLLTGLSLEIALHGRPSQT
jgi:hypothetical protein